VLAARRGDQTQPDAVHGALPRRPAQWRVFREGRYTLEVDTRSGTPTLMLSLEEKEAATASAPQLRQCPKWDGKPLTLDVSQTFAEGSKVRDFYSGNLATVSAGKITLQPAPNSNGLLLLERADTPPMLLSTGITPPSISC
jgi:alpha-amylase